MNDTAFVLFGATGDLSRRKILPSLCKLFTEGQLDSLNIIACGRALQDNEGYRSLIAPALQSFSPAEIEAFLSKVRYIQGELDDASFYSRLKEEIGSQEALYYLSLPPEFYSSVVEHLGTTGLTGKLLLEKPFGHNTRSASALEETLEQYFKPEDIFRVDHYFGKPGLQAMLAYRQNDRIFNSLIDRNTLGKVTCRIFESLDVGSRGAFYDSVGALRDVGQNHLLLMLATALMDLEEVRDSAASARAHVLEQLDTQAKEIVRAQYRGYTDDERIPRDSKTETYFKIVTESKNPHLEGIPIVLEGGKAFKEKETSIIFTFKDGSEHVFDINQPSTQYDHAALIQGALMGATDLFISEEEVIASWKFVDAILQQFKTLPLDSYEKGNEF